MDSTAFFGHIRNDANGLRTSSLLWKDVENSPRWNRRVCYMLRQQAGCSQPISVIPDMPKKCGIIIIHGSGVDFGG